MSESRTSCVSNRVTETREPCALPGARTCHRTVSFRRALLVLLQKPAPSVGTAADCPGEGHRAGLGDAAPSAISWEPPGQSGSHIPVPPPPPWHQVWNGDTWTQLEAAQPPPPTPPGWGPGHRAKEPGTYPGTSTGGGMGGQDAHNRGHLTDSPPREEAWHPCRGTRSQRARGRGHPEPPGPPCPPH